MLASILSARGHDLVFGIGSMIFLIALLPAVMKRTVMPVSTTALTGAVLAVFALTYLDMDFWYAMIVTVGTSICWTYLLIIAIKGRNV